MTATKAITTCALSGLLGLLLAGCGSTSSGHAVYLVPASSCKQWLSFSKGQHEGYASGVASRAEVPPGTYELGGVEHVIESKLDRGCQEAAAAGRAAVTKLLSVVPLRRTTTTAPSTTAGESASATANTPSKPAFSVNATGEGGDKIKLEGRFGSPVPSAQSDVNQEALSECPGSAGDGRAMIVRLDLVVALESSLAGQVGVETSFVGDRQLDFVMGFNPPSCVLGEAGSASVNFGVVQPHQSASFSMWIVLPDVITPDDPQPSEQTLREQGWLIEPLTLTLNGSLVAVIADQQRDTTGSRVVACQNNPAGKFIAVIGGTPHVLTEQNIKDYGEVC